MALTLYEKAAKRIESHNARMKRQAVQEARDRSDLWSLGAAGAGVIAAALIDERVAGDDGEAEWRDMPVNGLLGGGLLLAGVLAPEFPGRRQVIAGGLGLAAPALYLEVRERISLKSEDE